MHGEGSTWLYAEHRIAGERGLGWPPMEALGTAFGEALGPGWEMQKGTALGEALGTAERPPRPTWHCTVEDGAARMAGLGTVGSTLQ